ncbi:MAG TPA: NAD(P)/FAD-dependent oxidoreductase [Pyrinomonadaceae bacterium]|nr:NAD(P)/FAD-dependent oxidoreductase [Pyrinomonadaceae bacterium]
MLATANIFDVAIAGAGPAGTSAAIQLAMDGARVLLVEEKRFPRPKLCGEFISPECLAHFQRLGVRDQMLSAGGTSLAQTVFYSRRGHSVDVPSEWFKSGTNALGLSRSEMDFKLLDRAKSAGVVVIEGVHAAGLIRERERVSGIRVKPAHANGGSGSNDYSAVVTIDATGRARSLARHVDKGTAALKKRERPKLVAFKVHLEKARVAAGACEIYFYRGGYGGLSGVEGGISNLCFIVSADDVRRYSSDPEIVMREVVMKNARAAQTLNAASASTPWLSVSLEGFGKRELAPADGLLTVGDAAAFIDPFTGSGMLMALESGQVAAQTVAGHLPALRSGGSFDLLTKQYRSEYATRFNSRLQVSGFLRRAAFVPGLAEAAILLCGPSARLRRKLARATRPSAKVRPTTSPS